MERMEKRMLATYVNMAAVVIGGLLGLLFRQRISEKLTRSLMLVLGLCTAVIGVQSALETANILVVILCLVLGTLLGELLHLDERIEGAGSFMKRTLLRGRGGGRFTEGFISASILFCVGSMAVMGSLDAGIRGDYNIIFAKSAMDFVSSLAFSAAMGVGVLFSAVPILVFQGGITLLAGWIAPYLSAAVMAEMTAVGGTALLGLAVNILDLGKERIRVANMLPAIFLPIFYFPAAHWITTWIGGLLG